jgi:flavin-binding protein dodecin
MPWTEIAHPRPKEHLRWFDVVRTSGHIAGSTIEHYQVTLSLGFTMEDPS